MGFEKIETVWVCVLTKSNGSKTGQHAAQADAYQHAKRSQNRVSFIGKNLVEPRR